MGNILGPPQIVALVILAQRGLEEAYSRRNTARLLAEGGREVGADFYPIVIVTHLAWLGAIFFLIPANGPIVWPLVVVYLVLLVFRYWIIATLGQYWTHRIITVDGAPVVTGGPYAFIRHPNYAEVIAECFVLPLVFGSWTVALVMTPIVVAVLGYKGMLEDRAIATRRAQTRAASGA